MSSLFKIVGLPPEIRHLFKAGLSAEMVHHLNDVYQRITGSPILKMGSKTTPLRPLKSIEIPGADIWIKNETANRVHSFKWRGAYHLMHRLFGGSDQVDRRVCTASAGNHAQGVAAAARDLQVRATIVMPTTADPVKIGRVREIGGEFVDVVLVGATFNDALTHANGLMAADPSQIFVHPYDDLDVMAGQGTIGIEIQRQLACGMNADFDWIAVPVGGGGLLAGMLVGIKATRPEVKILGVEMAGTERLPALMETGQRIMLTTVNPYAGGVAVKQLGAQTAPIIHALLDAYVAVSDEAVMESMLVLNLDRPDIVEPSGALALAGLTAHIEQLRMQGALDDRTALKCLAVVSGGNYEKSRSASDLESARDRQGLAVRSASIP